MPYRPKKSLKSKLI
jgi:uncharacterized protein YqeY